VSYGLGWREDAPDPLDFDVAGRFGGPAVAFTASSLRRFKNGYLYQNGFGACVGFALARALHMALLAADERAGRPLSAAMPSPMFLYYNGRRQEAVEARALGQADPPVRDVGSFPRLVMKGAKAVGYCRERDYPFHDGAADINGYPNDNRKPPPRAYMSAFDQRNLTYRRVYETTEEGRAREVARCLAAGIPVIFGMTVDTSFMNHDGRSVVTSIDLSKKVGGHMMTVLEATDDGPVVDNWWGDNWGDGGEARLSWSLFANPLVRDIYAIEAAPAFSSEAP